MPTQLTKPVLRAVGTKVDGVVVMLAVEGVYIRPRKSRAWFGPVSYGALLLAAAERMVDKPSITKPRPHRRGGKVSRGLLSP